MKHYKLLEFLSNLNVRPLHESKAPLHKRKALLLTTFWRRFCYMGTAGCSWTTLV